tara:strand:+ start:288 stop:653 length:366 start_codon:yes stop_codon:yes gene_type:complete
MKTLITILALTVSAFAIDPPEVRIAAALEYCKAARAIAWEAARPMAKSYSRQTQAEVSKLVTAAKIQVYAAGANPASVPMQMLWMSFQPVRGVRGQGRNSWKWDAAKTVKELDEVIKLLAP